MMKKVLSYGIGSGLLLLLGLMVLRAIPESSIPGMPTIPQFEFQWWMVLFGFLMLLGLIVLVTGMYKVAKKPGNGSRNFAMGWLAVGCVVFSLFMINTILTGPEDAWENAKHLRQVSRETSEGWRKDEPPVPPAQITTGPVTSGPIYFGPHDRYTIASFKMGVRRVVLIPPGGYCIHSYEKPGELLIEHWSGRRMTLLPTVDVKVKFEKIPRSDRRCRVAQKVFNKELTRR